MPFKAGQSDSIYSRLNTISMISIGAFVLIGLSLLIALSSVKNHVGRIVEERFQETIDNSQLSRAFGLLNTRLNLYQQKFLGNPEYQRNEGEFLQGLLAELSERSNSPQLRSRLQSLGDNFAKYRQNCLWTNYLLTTRTELDAFVEQQLAINQEILAEKISERAFMEQDALYLEQLSRLVSTIHENFMEIATINVQEDYAKQHSVVSEGQLSVRTTLAELQQRAATLTASEPPLDRLGRQLLDTIDYYQYVQSSYLQQRAELEKQASFQRMMSSEIIGTMISFETEAKAAAEAARTEIGQMINTTLGVVLSFLVLLSGLFWWSHRHIFRRHILAPMTQVIRRLKQFQRGDRSTPMQLDRQDEWGRIESTFNALLGSIEESLSAVRNSEKRYREIFNNATEGIFRATLDGAFFELNPAAVRILGCTSAKQAKDYYTDLASQFYCEPGDRARMLQTLKRQGTCLNFEALMKRRNGEVFWGSLSNYLIRDAEGNILHVEGTFRDVSEHKAAQESLKQLQSYLQNIIDSMPSILIGVDPETRVTLWNRRAEEESALPADEAKGQTMNQVCRLFNPSDYLPQLQETLRTLKAGRLRQVKSLKKTADGSSRYFDILIYPLTMADTSGAVIHMDEISEQVRLQEMMVRSEKMQSVGSLASGLAHEINNPLAAILQNVQVLNRRLSPELSKNTEVAEELGIQVEVIQQYLERRGCDQMLESITEAGQKAARIVENMQSFSRGKSDLVRVSLAELVDKTLSLVASDYDMRYHYNYQRIEIVREFSPAPEVLCESSQIQQAILNLVKNAAQALSEASEPRIVLRLFPSDDGHVCLQIEDNGPGMAAELAQRVFDPFYSTQEVGKGPGLGLSIAYYIVQHSHQGRLTVESQPGRGTCFDMVLPVGQDEGV